MLREALASVRAQKDIEFEILVADDSPEGSAKAIVDEFSDGRVHFLHLPSCGGFVSRVRNVAAKRARHSLVIFLDDDDLLEAEALHKLACALQSHPTAALAFGQLVPFGPNRERVDHERRYFERAAARARRIRGPRSFAAQMLFDDALLASSAVMIRLNAFRASGGFDESLRIWEDGECFLRIGRAGGVVFVDAPIAHRRVGHPSLVTDLNRREEIAAAYKHWYAAYRKRFGAFEFAYLRLNWLFSKWISNLSRR